MEQAPRKQVGKRELIDWAVRRLIVNADDFGLTSGVNRAIAELHERGALSSATLMATGAAAEEAIALALRTPELGVGCHVVLVDGEPVLSAKTEIPHLADGSTGQLRASLGGFLGAVYRSWPLTAGAALTGELEKEAAAQVGLLQSRGLRLTHIDTHKHTHMFPAVLRPVLRAARAAGVSVVRNPFEPAWSRRATWKAPLARRVEVGLLYRMEKAFRRIVAEEGFTTTDGAVGVLATGTLDERTVTSLLDKMPDGTWELVTHPGYNDGDLAQVRTRLRESRATELEALTKVLPRIGIDLVSFADIAARGTRASQFS